MDRLKLDTQLTKEQLASLDEKRQKLTESMGGVFWLTNTREIRQRLHAMKRQVQDLIAMTRRYDRVNVKRADVNDAQRVRLEAQKLVKGFGGSITHGGPHDLEVFFPDGYHSPDGCHSYICADYADVLSRLKGVVTTVADLVKCEECE